MKFSLIETCHACPEQYDVYHGQTQVGYIRLRHGTLRLDYMCCGGETICIFNFEDKLKGCFDDDNERDRYLRKLLNVLKNKILDYRDNDLDISYEIK